LMLDFYGEVQVRRIENQRVPQIGRNDTIACSSSH